MCCCPPQVPIGEETSAAAIEAALLQAVPAERRPVLSTFLAALFELYRELNFVYMEVSPCVFKCALLVLFVIIMYIDYHSGRGRVIICAQHIPGCPL
jgi:hypothetical protein